MQRSQALRIEAIAECVNDERTLTIVRNAGVDFAQGQQVGSPQPLPDLLSMPLHAYD